MAWDKVTKVDSIAKRKAWTRSNLGKLLEHADSFKVAVGRGTDIASWQADRGANAGQQSVTVSKRGRLHRRVNHGCGRIATSWPRNSA
jgi:hypothetical protein